MDYKSRIIIDLTRFGQTGTIIIGAPRFRQQIELTNEISRLMEIEQKKTGIKVSELQGGTWNVCQRLAYVQAAPFAPKFEKFMEYTDMMDEKEPGSAAALWDAIVEAVERIDNGETSPLEPSQAVGTPQSV